MFSSNLAFDSAQGDNRVKSKVRFRVRLSKVEDLLNV